MTALAHLPRGIQAIVEPWEAHLDPTAGKLSLRTIAETTKFGGELVHSPGKRFQFVVCAL